MNGIKYLKIWKLIKDFKQISLFTHVDPDGDTIGSSVGLKHLILDNFPNKEVKIIGDLFPSNLKFLGETNQVEDDFIKNSLVIVIDTSTSSRVYDQRYSLSNQRIKIDHHHDEGGEWLVNIAGDHFAATGEILVDLVQENNLTLSKSASEALLCSIYSDTECFTHRQITPKTWKRVELLKNNGADLRRVEKKYNDLGLSNKFVDYIKTNRIIKDKTSYLKIDQKTLVKYNPDLSLFKAFVRALKSKEIIKWTLIVELEDYIRIGIRSNDQFDVSKIAKEFNGGGHKTSAGTKVKTWKKADEFIKKFIAY